MFGSNKNSSFPAFMEGSQYQHGSNVSQLQLFGTFLPGVNINPINYAKNDQQSALNRSCKRSRNTDVITKQQMLQISLNDLPHNEAYGLANMPEVNAVSTGLRLFYNDDEHNSFVSASANMRALPTITSPSDNFTTEINCQMDELDHYMRVQGEQLQKDIKEISGRHIASFLIAINKDVSRRLREKELEIEDMNRKNRELTEGIKQLAIDAQSWYHRACYNASVVDTLRVNLKAAEEGMEGCGKSRVEDAASSCKPDVILAGIPQKKKKVLHLPCKVCKEREACMLLVDCRHLCLCEDCEGCIDVCPTCCTTKTWVFRVSMS